jgi:anti-sigma factor RsiW
VTQRLRTEELLAAYASGAELTEEERASVEALLAGSPAARAEVESIGALLGELRAAAPEPPPASEAVVRAVRIACAQPVTFGDKARSWWRRRWMIAVPAVVAAGALAAVAIVAASPEPRATAPSQPAPIAKQDLPAPAPGPDDDVPDVPLWLAGEATELAGLDDESADDFERELGDELAAIGAAAEMEDLGWGGLLPDDDLEWVDALDDETAEALDEWLAEQPS